MPGRRFWEAMGLVFGLGLLVLGELTMAAIWWYGAVVGMIIQEKKISNGGVKA